MKTTLLAISGSLREHSTNTEVLRAAALLAPDSLSIRLYEGLGGLPHFNPDLDAEGSVPPPEVLELRALVGAADGLLICSPEYAHGVPGALKNALDWLVSGPEMPNKPVALLNASPRSTHAQTSLAETLRTMSATLVPGASIELALGGRRLGATAIAAEPEFATALRTCLNAMVAAAPAGRAQLY